VVLEEKAKKSHFSEEMRFLKIAIHTAALLPLALLLLDLALGRLSANPIREVTLRTGRYAIALLVLSLACTPLNTLFGLRQALVARKPLGLYAALYAALHLLTFIAWDYAFQFDLIWLEVREKRFIQVGLLAFLILMPLAVTSTRRWVRRMGVHWKRLHRLAYLAGLFAVLHFVLLVKVTRPAPLIYAALLALLLVVRIPFVRRAIRAARERIRRIP
jgi:sulfoxide reductase heme-binding subunit YedZ